MCRGMNTDFWKFSRAYLVSTAGVPVVARVGWPGDPMHVVHCSSCVTPFRTVLSGAQFSQIYMLPTFLPLMMPMITSDDNFELGPSTGLLEGPTCRVRSHGTDAGLQFERLIFPYKAKTEYFRKISRYPSSGGSTSSMDANPTFSC